MNPVTTHDRLIRLRDLILEERRCASQLDMDGLEKVTGEKEELINLLIYATELDPADRELAEQIRRENRRNAFLFRTTLGWIRETMEFFGKRTVTATYAADAGTIPAQVHGRLLSGKI
jgi:hypothetical protein